MTPPGAASDKGDVSRRRARPPKDWKARFLTAFEELLTVTDACAVAGVSRKTAYLARQQDGDFASAWADAEERIVETLEREAWRRAVTGWDERPLFDNDGNVIGHVRRFSDRLLELLMKGHRPQRYRDNVRVEHTGTDGAPIDVQMRALIGDRDPVALSPQGRRELAAVLKREAERAASEAQQD